MSKRAKRQAFAYKAKRRRAVERVRRKHKSMPGFLGVVSNFVLHTEEGDIHSFGLGVLFAGVKHHASP